MTQHATVFAAYIRGAASITGYDLTSPRSGGKKALADATGMSQSSVGRMLAGQTIPDARFFEPLARALHLPVGRLFELSGIAPEGSLTSPQDAEPRPLTPHEAAAQLDIRDPRNVALFVALTTVLQEQEGAES